MELMENEEEMELQRTAESGKVMFEIPLNHNIDHKRKSSIGFRDSPDNRSEKIESTSISLRSEAQKSEIFPKESSLILARPSVKLSKIKLSEIGQYDAETVKEIEERRKTIFAAESDLSQVASLFMKIDVIRRSLDKGSANVPTELSGKSSSRFRLSDNVPVRSMTLDLPRSADLSVEEADAYVEVLEKVLEQLELIRYRIPAEIDDRWDEGFKDLDDKYDVPEEPKFSLREYLGLPPLVLSVSEKLQRDRTYIYNTLNELTEELRKNQRYDRLEQEIDKLAKTTEDEHNLEVNHEIWTEQLEQLLTLIQSERLSNEIEVRKWIIGVHDSAADIDDAIFLSKSKLGYVRRWESTRLEGQRLLLESSEQELQDKLSEYENTEKMEEIVSEEIRAYLQQDYNKFESDYKELMIKFNDEVDEKDEEIEYLKQDIEEVEKNLEENLKILEERQEFVEECSMRRKLRDEEKAYWDAVNGAAMVIQALWRGYMVRRQLGAYRGLWKTLKKRKKLAAKRRKKLEARRRKIEEKKAAEEAKNDKKRK